MRNNLVISSETRIHLIKHFIELPEEYILYLIRKTDFSKEQIIEKLKNPGSKFFTHYAETPDDLFDIIKKIFNENYFDNNIEKWEHEFVYTKSEFPDGIGTDNLISKAELSDKQIDQISIENINGYNASVLKGKPRKTWALNIIAKKTVSGDMHLVTAFPGMWAPAFPNSYNPGTTQYNKSIEFWKNNVFIIHEPG